MNPTPRRSALGTGLVTAAVGMLLTGCGLSYVAPDEHASETPPSSPAADATTDGATTDGAAPASSSTPTPTPAPAALAADESADAAEIPADLEARYGDGAQVVSCPAGAYTLESVGAVVRLDGSCATVTVTAAGAVLLAPEVERLEVAGTGIVVGVGSAGSVEITGTSNEVRWGSGTPQVTDTGIGNVTGPAQE